ncbi:hypothetical protein BDV93DRAFT_562245 [Ceratobasidium sp. AG-I]|nr:hypothetical protein BDV93DRAFT_562245 [Ceratobasidium sp. AG-I]
MSPCVRAEVETSNRTTPDKITGHALNWLIMHSRKPVSQRMAIRAIAGANSNETLQELLSIQPGIFPLVVQSFTSCFNKKDVDSHTLETASLHGQALAVLAHRAASKHITQDEQLLKWGIDLSTMVAVEEKFRLLSKKNEYPNIAAFGLMGLSSWHDFSKNSGGLRFAYGETLEQLTRTLNNQSLSPSLASGILRTLAIECTHWVPNIDTARRQSILSGLITFVHTTTPQLRPKIACTLAVLALAITGQYRRPRLSSSGEPNDAEMLSEFYLKNPSDCDRDADSLMLLGLAGIMDHYAHCVLDSTSLEDMKAISIELGRLSVLGKAHLINPDNLILQGVDIRAYIVDVLVLHFQKSQVSENHADYDQLSTALLKSVNDKPFIWINHGAQLGLPIVQMLARSKHIGLQEQCLIAVINHGQLMGPLVSSMEMLLSYEVPDKLIRLVQDKQTSTSILLPFIRTIFEHIAEHLSQNTLLEEHDLLDHIIEAGFFETVFRRILYQPESNSRHVGLWRRAAIIYLKQKGQEMKYKDRYPIYAYLLETILPAERRKPLFKEMLQDIARVARCRWIIRQYLGKFRDRNSRDGQTPIASGSGINGTVADAVPTTNLNYPETAENGSLKGKEVAKTSPEPSKA